MLPETACSFVIKKQIPSASSSLHEDIVVVVENISELYYQISNTSSTIVIIAINIEDLFTVGPVDPWHIINALDTILSMCKSDAIIVGVANLATDSKKIKDFLALGSKCIGIIPIGEGFSISDAEISISYLNKKIPYIPPPIVKKISPKKNRPDGFPVLTTRQEQIFNLIVTRGASNKMIAKTLSISESTVKLHVALLLKKFCVTNRTQLALSKK